MEPNEALAELMRARTAEAGSWLAIDFAYKCQYFEAPPAYYGWSPTDHPHMVAIHSNSKWARGLGRRLGWIEAAPPVIEALERLAEEKPTVLLSDIEMPRMDGFDLVRNVRADARLADLPVIMITSRIAQKHRDYAAELGVDHYLGKPYGEEELLSLVGQHVQRMKLRAAA